MKQKKTQLLGLVLSIVLMVSLAAGAGIFQRTGKDYMTDTLKKASLSFAAARSVNALISVAQKVEAGGSLKLLGTGGSASFAPLEWLDPVNDLIEQFSLIMLASCVAMGILLFLNQSMPWLSLAVLLPLSLLLLLSAIGIKTAGPVLGRRLFRSGYKLLIVTALMATLMPAMATANFLVYSFFLENTYETAALSLNDTRATLSTVKSDDGWLHTLENLQQQAGTLKNKAEQIIAHVLDLTVVFLIQTIFLPLVVIWLAIKLISYVFREDFPLPGEALFVEKQLKGIS